MADKKRKGMEMLYNDHIAVSGKNVEFFIFSLFVDVADSRVKSKLQKNSIVTRLLNNVPRKPRSTLSRKRKENWGSSFLGDHATSSVRKTLKNLSFSPSLTLIITDKSEETDMTNPNCQPSSSVCDKKPPVRNTNPNCQPSSSVCRKKPPVRNCKLKIEKVAALSWKGRDTPERLFQLMADMNGDDPKLVFEKSLTKTDIRTDQSRLLMPFKSLICNDFLTPVESTLVEEDINTDDSAGVGAIMFDGRKETWGIIMKRWDMKKKTGKGSCNYALICGWSDMVEENGLKEGDNISVWSFRRSFGQPFRRHRLLCFVILPPPT